MKSEDRAIYVWLIASIGLSYLTFYLNSIDHWTTWPTGALCAFSSMCVLAAGSNADKADKKREEQDNEAGN